jgi:hypothetical protein
MRLIGEWKEYEIMKIGVSRRSGGAEVRKMDYARVRRGDDKDEDNGNSLTTQPCSFSRRCFLSLPASSSPSSLSWLFDFAASQVMLSLLLPSTFTALPPFV